MVFGQSASDDRSIYKKNKEIEKAQQTVNIWAAVTHGLEEIHAPREEQKTYACSILGCGSVRRAGRMLAVSRHTAGRHAYSMCV